MAVDFGFREPPRFVTSRGRQFSRRLAKYLAELASGYARPQIPSRTLSKALTEFVDSDWQSRSYIPHYWAVYVHDGRKGFRPRQAQVLVWFRDRANDPRIAGGYPVRASQIRRLSKQQFYHWLQMNRIARMNGEDPPMIVTKSVGPTEPNRFYSNEHGMRGFDRYANDRTTSMVRGHFRDQLRDVLHIKDETTVHLPVIRRR